MLKLMNMHLVLCVLFNTAYNVQGNCTIKQMIYHIFQYMIIKIILVWIQKDRYFLVTSSFDQWTVSHCAT